MGQSGTKLVVFLVGLAVTAGVVSWWYRFEAAHQATMFWGAEASKLIALPAEVEVAELALIKEETTAGEAEAAEVGEEDSTRQLELGRRYKLVKTKPLTNARGMVHLRHVLMSDGSYEWDSPVDPAQIDWKWCLRFFEANREALVVLSDDLAAIGRVVEEGESQVEAYSCRPLTESLDVYFADLGLRDASKSE